MLMSAYARAEDLIRIGAYKPGTDALLDKAIAALPAMNTFLQQNPSEIPLAADTASGDAGLAFLVMAFRFKLDACRSIESLADAEEAALYRIVRENRGGRS